MVTSEMVKRINDRIEEFGSASVEISADTFDYMNTYDGDSWGYASCTITSVVGENVEGTLVGYDDFTLNINDITGMELNF